MTRESDRELLIEFCVWCRKYDVQFRGRDSADLDESNVAAFLYSREPSESPRRDCISAGRTREELGDGEGWCEPAGEVKP